MTVFEMAEDVKTGHALYIGEDGRLHSWRNENVPISCIALKPFQKGELVDLDAPGRPMTWAEVESL